MIAAGGGIESCLDSHHLRSPGREVSREFFSVVRIKERFWLCAERVALRFSQSNFRFFLEPLG